jgi:hypothetical protein
MNEPSKRVEVCRRRGSGADTPRGGLPLHVTSMVVRVVQAQYENGVLRPAQQLRQGEQGKLDRRATSGPQSLGCGEAREYREWGRPCFLPSRDLRVGRNLRFSSHGAK